MKTMCSGTATLVALGMLAALGALLMTGCEEGKGTTALVVSPSYVDLTAATTSNNVLTFTVTGGTRALSLPLEWRVSNPGLGRIAASGGFSATYTPTPAHGDNAIIVTDQYDAEGVASVHQ